MEFAAYLIASVAVAAYLDKKSKTGNVAFSILFIFQSAFYLVITRHLDSYLSLNTTFIEAMEIFRSSVDKTFGLVSAGTVIRLSMFAVVGVACLGALYFIYSIAIDFIVKHFSTEYVRPYFVGDLSRLFESSSSIVDASAVPLAARRTYIKFGVLRN